MAKQIINTGTAPNSGTGDPLRSAFTKINENFTELYNRSVFSGSYADLTNKPTIPADVSQLTDTTNLLSGGVSLGLFKIENNTIGTSNEGGGWGGHDIYLSPNGESYAWIHIPNDANTQNASPLIVGNGNNAGAGVHIRAGGYGWEFKPNAVLQLPAAGDIVDSNGQSVLGGGNANTGDFVFTNNQMEILNGEDIFIKAGDDLFLDALDDDVFLRASDDIRLRTGYNFTDDTYQWEIRYNDSGTVNFYSFAEDSTYGYIQPINDAGSLGISFEGAGDAYIKSNYGNRTWKFGGNGNLTLPSGSTISETQTTTVISPPGAAAGQSLVIRPTAAVWTVTSSGYIVYGSPITVTVTQMITNNYFGTVNYEITGPGVTEQTLGRPLTGSVVITTAEGESSRPVTWTIPANSNITEFTFTLTTVDGIRSQDFINENDPALYYSFEPNSMPTGNFVIVTNNGVTSSEANHVHLISGNPVTTDIYLGDDDQYIKIEKNGGDVVIGTNANTTHWTFDTDGELTLPNSAIIRQSTNDEIDSKYAEYIDAIAGWEYTRTIGEYSTEPGWTFNTWQVNGTNVDDYLQQLATAWQIQNSPSSPPQELIFIPAISAALYQQIRAQLQYLRGRYQDWQLSLSSVDILAGGETLSLLSNNKIQIPGTIQTDAEEDITIRTRYASASSPPGSVSYTNIDFVFGTNGTLTFPNGTVQTGASIDLVYLKYILANSNSFDDFKNTIASL